MSQVRAQREIERFLSTKDPEVLSISGRWGVGKTHAWDEAIKNIGSNAPLERYAYVSAFGVRSIDALKTAIFQNTIARNALEREPTLKSFFENLESFEDVQELAETGTRKGFSVFQKLAEAIPYAGKAADLLSPGASLLIRNQIICIDDIERSGSGLDVADILGFVCELRERRNCKIVLLLNEEGLSDAKASFREYLEKAVDQAIRFEPTAEESANAAICPDDQLGKTLSERTIALGITNIRVIRRIRRFLSFIEPKLTAFHPDARGRVVQSIALLGWCVFEPKLAPRLERIRSYSRYSNLFSEEKPSEDDRTTDMLLAAYEFPRFEDIDSVILNGLQAGGFDEEQLAAEMTKLEKYFLDREVSETIGKPWEIIRSSFNESDADELAAAFITSIKKHAAMMTAEQASEVGRVLEELGRKDDADQSIDEYVKALDARPRSFIEMNSRSEPSRINQKIKEALQMRLQEAPIERDPAEILLKIHRSQAWHPEDTAFLASVSVDEYRDVLKRCCGEDLRRVVYAALQFGNLQPPSKEGETIARLMTEALRKVSNEGPLNAMRVKAYLGNH